MRGGRWLLLVAAFGRVFHLRGFDLLLQRGFGSGGPDDLNLRREGADAGNDSGSSQVGWDAVVLPWDRGLPGAGSLSGQPQLTGALLQLLRPLLQLLGFGLEPGGLLRAQHADVPDRLEPGEVVVREHHAA